MTELIYNQGADHLERKMIHLQKEIDDEEIARKKQEREIKILGNMERDIRNKLSLLENTLEKMENKKKMSNIFHQRSTSNPEEAIDNKREFTIEENERHAPLYRASQSYDYRRLQRAHPLTPETRRRQVVTPVRQSHEMQRNRGSGHNVAMESYGPQRAQTPGSFYQQQHAPIVNKNYTRTIQTRPSPISKAVSTGVTSYKNRYGDGFEAQHVITNPTRPYKTSVNPRELKHTHIMNTHQIRSSSAFGMYKTTPSATKSRTQEMVRERSVEMRRKVPISIQQEMKPNTERSHSMENLLEKRPLAKTNSTILHSSDFKIISLESRTIAQQIKLKELEKNYFSKNTILSKTEWVSFVSKFSETQKEVRNLDIEWQELFSELMFHNSEYNEHMNKIRKWVTALKVDSKFLQDIMSDNLVTAL